MELKDIYIIARKVFYYLIRMIVPIFQSINKKRIILIQENFSGSHTFAIYKLLSKGFRENYDIILYQENKTVNFYEYIKKVFFLASGKIILTTHESYKFKKSTIHIQLWHAVMIKKMGAMLLKHNEKFQENKSWKNADYILSYSDTHTTFLNAMMVTDPRKYKIFGGQRNDFLFLKNDIQAFEDYFKIKNFKKKIVIVPTMRFESKTSENSEELDQISLCNFFVDPDNAQFFDDDILIFIKPHPHDEIILSLHEENLPQNVVFLNDQKLRELGIDFYEVLNIFDLLVTDYSSIFFDFLLLDKPIVFYDPTEDNLKKSRGFVIHSIKNFLPGDVAENFENLKKFIKKNLEKDYAFNKDKRNRMREIIHYYKDGKSTERIENFMSELLS